MKKIILSLFLLFIGLISVRAKTINVEFSDCVDGDTAKFIYNGEEITARFLAIDTPETKHPTKGIEPYGKEASDYTCNMLKNSKEIKLEYDKDSDELDKYNRHLVWVFVDGSLLQKELISNGLASVAYLYGDYKYTDKLEIAEQEAEDKKLGIWSDEEYIEDTSTSTKQTDKKESIETNNNYKEYILIAGIIIMLCLFSTKTRKKVKAKVKRDLKKRLK